MRGSNNYFYTSLAKDFQVEILFLDTSQNLKKDKRMREREREGGEMRVGGRQFV